LNKIYQIEKFIEHFDSLQVFSTTDIITFYQNYEPNIKKNTVIKRISTLVKTEKIERVGKGLYCLGQEKNYLPFIENELKSLFKKLIKKYPLLTFCVWNTKQFNEFMVHQPAQFYTLIETEKDSSEYVFHFLKELNKEVYLNPNKMEIEKYVSVAKTCLVVKDLISEAPIQIVDKFPTITIEKMLVDLYCDTDLYSVQQGSEIEIIFRTAFEKYTINKAKLFRYSDRRKRKQELIEFIKYLQIN